MPNVPTEIPDTTDQSSRAAVDAVVVALARLLGEAAAREWGATNDEPNLDDSHDQIEQDPSPFDGA